MYRLNKLFRTSVLTVFSLVFLLSLSSWDVIIDNTTDCYYILDVTDNCMAVTGGPMDSPPVSLQTYGSGVHGVSGAASTVEDIFVLRDDGYEDDIEFGTSCTTGGSTSPHNLDEDCLPSTPTYVSWSVCGSDLCIDIHY